MSDRERHAPAWMTLDADEHVRFVVSPSRNLVLGSLGVGFMLLIAMSVGVGFFTDVTTGRMVSFATLVLIVGLLVGAYGLTETRQYVLTNDRAVVGVGLRTKRTSAVALDAVDAVEVVQPTWQQFLNVGTVRLVTTAGTSVAFELVERPDVVGNRVRRFAGVEGTDATRA
jgi:uncharacterized membrane protein YdbT with pleckstrin-like domain